MRKIVTSSARPSLAPPEFGGLADWRAIELLFDRHGLERPPTRLRDELVGILQWARFGRDEAERQDRLSELVRLAIAGTHYET